MLHRPNKPLEAIWTMQIQAWMLKCIGFAQDCDNCQRSHGSDRTDTYSPPLGGCKDLPAGNSRVSRRESAPPYCLACRAGSCKPSGRSAVSLDRIPLQAGHRGARFHSAAHQGCTNHQAQQSCLVDVHAALWRHHLNVRARHIAMRPRYEGSRQQL